MTKPQLPFKKADIARAFSMASCTYDKAAFIQKEVGERLLEKLSYSETPLKNILDVGAGTGLLTRQLQQKFPQSSLFGLDLAQGMMQWAKNTQRWHLWKRNPSYLCADMEKLPFLDDSFDLVFSNFTLQWSLSVQESFAEFKRVLKPNGILLFSTLGPKTLYELRDSWFKANSAPHVNTFMDMHDYGDLLLNTDFSRPVMDMEMITVTYTEVKHLLQDLKATGARNINNNRTKGMTSKHCFQKMLQAYEAYKTDGVYPATYEILYGHAIKSQSTLYRAQEDGTIKIPANKIPLLA